MSNQLKQNLRDIGKDLKRDLHDAQEAAQEAVEKNPWAAIGVVAFVALIIGFLMGRGGRSKR